MSIDVFIFLCINSPFNTVFIIRDLDLSFLQSCNHAFVTVFIFGLLVHLVNAEVVKMSVLSLGGRDGGVDGEKATTEKAKL